MIECDRSGRHALLQHGMQVAADMLRSPAVEQDVPQVEGLGRDFAGIVGEVPLARIGGKCGQVGRQMRGRATAAWTGTMPSVVVLT